jgi:hypothetical protein
MLAVSDFIFAFGIAGFIARAMKIDKVDRLVLKTIATDSAKGANFRRQDRDSQRVEDNAFHLHARATAAGVA